jgi:hypothetical protein
MPRGCLRAPPHADAAALARPLVAAMPLRVRRLSARETVSAQQRGRPLRSRGRTTGTEPDDVDERGRHADSPRHTGQPANTSKKHLLGSETAKLVRTDRLNRSGDKSLVGEGAKFKLRWPAARGKRDLDRLLSTHSVENA